MFYGNNEMIHTLILVRAANLDTLDKVLSASSLVSISSWCDSRHARNLSWKQHLFLQF